MNKKNILYGLFPTLLLLFGIFLPACSKNNMEYSKMIIDKVVEIKVCDSDENIVGYATGTVVTEKELILTNRHAIRYLNKEAQKYEFYPNIYCRYYNEDNYFKVSVNNISTDRDLALLDTNEHINNYFELSNIKPIMSEEVHTIGNSNGFGLAYSRGYIAMDSVYVHYKDQNNIYINACIPVSEGNSGGPLVSSDGKLLGIITFRLKNRNGEVITNNCYCITMSNIINYIQNASI